MLNKKVIAIFWNVIILVLCLINLSNVNQVQSIRIPHIDKMVHFAIYTTSAFLWCWALLNKQQKSFKLNLALIVVSLFFFGLMIEFLQDVFPTKRSFEWLDVVCNSLGILTGMLIYFLYLKFKPHHS